MSLEKVDKPMHTLALRLTLWYATLFLLSSALLFLASYLMISSELKKRADLELSNELKEFISLYKMKGIAVVKDAIMIEVESEGTGNMFLRLVENSGEEFVFPNISTWVNPDVGRTSLEKVKWGEDHVFETLSPSAMQRNFRMLTASLGAGNALQIGKSTEGDELLLKTCRDTFGVIALIVLVLGGIGGFLVSKGSLRGLVTITRAVNEISEGNLDRRVTVKGRGDEIDTLAGAFNRMSARIQGVIRQMAEMTDNIAHDLKSPITRIRGIAETTLIDPGSSTDYEDMAGSVVEECDRLLGMINTMLDISEAEAGVVKMARVEVDVAQVVRDACELFAPLADNSQIRIVQRLAPGSLVHGDLLKIQRAISNLLDNSLKYTPAGGTVTASVNGDKARVTVTIEDTGIGIPEADLPRVFDRFFRGDASRSRPGTGLGLTLARAFARAHGGDIGVESRCGKGTLVTMVLPSYP